MRLAYPLGNHESTRINHEFFTEGNEGNEVSSRGDLRRGVEKVAHAFNPFSCGGGGGIQGRDRGEPRRRRGQWRGGCGGRGGGRTCGRGRRWRCLPYSRIGSGGTGQ